MFTYYILLCIMYYAKNLCIMYISKHMFVSAFVFVIISVCFMFMHVFIYVCLFVCFIYVCLYVSATRGDHYLTIVASFIHEKSIQYLVDISKTSQVYDIVHVPH